MVCIGTITALLHSWDNLTPRDRKDSFGLGFAAVRCRKRLQEPRAAVLAYTRTRTLMSKASLAQERLADGVAPTGSLPCLAFSNRTLQDEAHTPTYCVRRSPSNIHSTGGRLRAGETSTGWSVLFGRC